MSKNVYPTGWDEARVKQIIAHYQADPDSEEVSGYDASTPTTLIEVPADLLPAIRHLIAEHEGTLEASDRGPEPADWTEWRHLEAAADWTGAAVYEIRLVDFDGAPHPIRRFLGIDAQGILCIGCTKRSMEGRRREFDKARRSPGSPHSEAILLRRLLKYSRLEQVYPGAVCEYRFQPITSGDARQQEDDRLKDYICRFGEVPPLNSAIPNRHYDEGWQRACQRSHRPKG